MTDELVQIQGLGKLMELWDVNDTDSFVDDMYNNFTDAYDKEFKGNVDEEV